MHFTGSYKAVSWRWHYRYQNCFHGVDLCQLREQALNEYLRQPIVDTFDIGICLAKSIRYSLDFMTAEEKDLHHLGKAAGIPFTSSTVFILIALHSIVLVLRLPL